MAAFWHPFADMAVVPGRELVISRGEGVYLWDAEGRRYLDGTASLWHAHAGQSGDGGSHELQIVEADDGHLPGNRYLTALALGRNSDVFAAGVDIHGVHDRLPAINTTQLAHALVGDGITEADLKQALKVEFESVIPSPTSA